MRRYRVELDLSDGNKLKANVTAENQAEAIAQIEKSDEALEFIGDSEILRAEIFYIGEYTEPSGDQYILQDSTDEGYKVATHSTSGVVIKWKVGAFNETAKITSLYDTDDPLAIATAIRELSEWLAINHRELI